MNLEKLNLVELDAVETRETEGGLVPPFWVWVGLGLAWDTLSSPRAAYDSFVKGYNANI